MVKKVINQTSIKIVYGYDDAFMPYYVFFVRDRRLEWSEESFSEVIRICDSFAPTAETGEVSICTSSLRRVLLGLQSDWEKRFNWTLATFWRRYGVPEDDVGKMLRRESL